MNFDLFRTESNFEPVPLDGGDVQLMLGFLGKDEAERTLHDLITSTPWRAETVVVWGKSHPQPRLIAWYGDLNRKYTYSGIAMTPMPWTPLLLAIRLRVVEACVERFNSVLLNYYRNERDSMGMHSDDESELGPRPTIASVSLGQERVFTFAPRRSHGRRRIRLSLPSGSLLLMKGDTQRNWKHGIAKAKGHMGPRVNLTFRKIGFSDEPYDTREEALQGVQ